MIEYFRAALIKLVILFIKVICFKSIYHCLCFYCCLWLPIWINWTETLKHCWNLTSPPEFNVMHIIFICSWIATNFLHLSSALCLSLCVFKDWHPLRLLLPLTFNTTVYNNSYSLTGQLRRRGWPLLWVRAEPFYHTTYPVMDEPRNKLARGLTALFREGDKVL